MAANQVYDFGGLETLRGKASHPTTPASGSPALFGQIPGVALTDEDSDGYCTLAMNGVWNLLVTGQNDSGAVAVNNGDILYYDAGEINKDSANGVRFGYAAVDATVYGSQVVASGAQTTIRVKVGS